MWIRVALDKTSIHGNIEENLWISGNMEEFYFDDNLAAELEKDGFLIEMWNQLDALFDWGDYDFFGPDKCIALKKWLEKRLKGNLNTLIIPVYDVMLKYADKAISLDTGIAFDF